MKGSQVTPGSRLWIPWYQIAKKWEKSYKVNVLFFVEIKQRISAFDSPVLLFLTTQGYLVWLNPDDDYQEPTYQHQLRDAPGTSWYLKGGRVPSISQGVSID